MAMAILDAAMAADIDAARIRRFAEAQRRELDRSDEDMLRLVETTRVEMETF